MTFTFYPKALLCTAVFVVMFGVALALAADLARGIVAAGVGSLLAYLFVEVFTSVNPAAWWRERRNGQH